MNVGIFFPSLGVGDHLVLLRLVAIKEPAGKLVPWLPFSVVNQRHARDGDRVIRVQLPKLRDCLNVR